MRAGAAGERLYLRPVERPLQERLVGAAVLVAMAVIVVPELLSGPGAERSDSLSRDRADEVALKTYTIDLSNPRGRPESSTPAASQPKPEVQAAAPPVADNPPIDAVAVPSKAPPQERDPAPASASLDEPRSVPQPSAPKPAPASAPRGDWAVQVGSFANRSAADRTAAQLEQRGYRSFITQYRADGRTLHRVRIGPLPTREAADATVRKLKGEGTAATVVANR